MKYKEIDLYLLIIAFKKKWKIIFAVTLIFCLLGVTVGFAYTKFINNEFKASATELEQITDEYLTYDEWYYSSYYDLLEYKMKDIKTYMNSISIYRNTLYNELELAINDLEALEMTQIYNLIRVGYTVPIDHVFQSNLYYNNKIQTAELGLVEARAAQEFIVNIQGEIPDNVETIALYNEQFSKAAMVATYLKEIEYSQYKLSILADVEKMQADGQKVEELLGYSTETLNQIIGNFNVLLNEIAIDNNLIITAGIGVDSSCLEDFSIQIENTYTVPNAQDDILAFTVFFTLLGITLGYLTALCKVAKNEEN